jgi:topoisomerase-4 subunit A
MRGAAAVPAGRVAGAGQGKGNKLIGIPGSRVASREEFVTQVAVIPQGQPVTLHAGKRKFDAQAFRSGLYRGERGRAAPSCRAAAAGG